MPNKTVSDLMEKVHNLEAMLMRHLIESGGIKTQLRTNTWLTGIILIALLAKFVIEWYKH